MPGNVHATPSSHVALAVIGARGFLGIRTLAELVACYTPPPQGAPWAVIYAIDTAATVGGAAYASPRPEWKLNVPDSKMSFDEARPDDFTLYLKRRGLTLPPTAPYAPRIHYGAYLTEKYRETLAAAALKGIRIMEINGEVRDVAHEPDGAMRIRYTETGLHHGAEASVRADLTLLALGNQDPVPFTLADGTSHHPRVIQMPLKDMIVTETHLRQARKRGATPVFILRGFGNTGMDVALSLFDMAERARIRIRVIGLQRQNAGIVKHAEQEKPFDPARFLGHATARSLYETFRDALASAELAPGDVIGPAPFPCQRGTHDASAQDVADALRSVINMAGEGFSDAERAEWKRAYDYLYRFWRNRITRTAGAILERKMIGGELILMTGDLKLTPLSEGRLRADILPRPAQHAGRPFKAEGRNVYVFNTVSPAVGLHANACFRSLMENGVMDPAHAEGFRLMAGSYKAVTKIAMPLYAVSQLNRIDPGGVRELRCLGAKAGEELSREIMRLQHEHSAKRLKEAAHPAHAVFA